MAIKRLHALKQQALAQLRLGRAHVVGETRLGPEVVPAVSDPDSLCLVAQQAGVLSIYVNKALVPD